MAPLGALGPCGEPQRAAVISNTAKTKLLWSKAKTIFLIEQPLKCLCSHLLLYWNSIQFALNCHYYSVKAHLPPARLAVTSYISSPYSSWFALGQLAAFTSCFHHSIGHFHTLQFKPKWDVWNLPWPWSKPKSWTLERPKDVVSVRMNNGLVSVQWESTILY